jgi:hypothetical protein
MAPVNQCLWARNFMEIHIWIVCILEPIKAEIASISELPSRQISTLAAVSISTICIPHPCTIELFGAALRKLPDTAARNSKVEVVGVEIAASVSYLNNHLFSSERSGCKCESC